MKFKYTIENPSVEPITLVDAKVFLKLDDFTEDDDLVSSLISAAREYCEDFTCRILAKREVVQMFDAPMSLDNLLAFPTKELTKLEFKQSGTFTEVDVSIYIVDGDEIQSYISLIGGESWPDVDAGKSTIRATYQSGFDPLPAKIKIAMQKLISTWYDDRYDGKHTFPSRVKDILHSYIRFV